MPSGTFDWEKAAAREKVYRDRADSLPLPEYCDCGGRMHYIRKIHGRTITDQFGRPAHGTICDFCHMLAIYEDKEGTLPTSADLRRQTRDWVKEIRAAGYVVDEENGQYKVRNKDGSGMMTAFAVHPRGYRTLENSKTAARRAGVDWSKPEKVKRTKNGTGPEIAPMSPSVFKQRQKHVAAQIREILQQVGGTRAEFARFALEWGESEGVPWRPASPKAAEQQLKAAVADQGLSEKAMDFWVAVIDGLEKPVEPTMETTTEADEEEDPVVSGGYEAQREGVETLSDLEDHDELAEAIGQHMRTIRVLREQLAAESGKTAVERDRAEEAEKAAERLTKLNREQGEKINGLLHTVKALETQVEEMEGIGAGGLDPVRVGTAFKTARTVLVRVFPEVDADLVDDAFKLGREVAGLEG